MATTTLNRISKNIAAKLQDPVSLGTADGSRYTAADRLDYIIRAYRRLLRLVTMLYPELINNLFTNYYVIDYATTDSAGELDASAYAEVHGLYVKQPSDEVYVKATPVPASDHLTVSLGYNAFYKPDINTSQYFWSLIGGKIACLPAVQLNCKIENRKNTAYLIEGSGYDGSYDLDIPPDNTDLLVSLAAMEAYMDLGQTNMVTLYRQDTMDQLQLLAQTDKKNEKEDTTNEV